MKQKKKKKKMKSLVGVHMNIHMLFVDMNLRTDVRTFSSLVHSLFIIGFYKFGSE